MEQELALDPLAIEDAVANLERTKAIRYGRYTVLTAYATYLDPVEAPTATTVDVRSRRNPTTDDLPPGSVLRLDRLSMFVLPRGVITIRRHPGFDIKEVVDRTENNADLLKHGAGALLHSLLDVIVDSHFDAYRPWTTRNRVLNHTPFPRFGIYAQLPRQSGTDRPCGHRPTHSSLSRCGSRYIPRSDLISYRKVD